MYIMWDRRDSECRGGGGYVGSIHGWSEGVDVVLIGTWILCMRDTYNCVYM